MKIANNFNGGPTVADFDKFGRSVVSLGDLDGDGIDDLAVGAWQDHEPGGLEGGAVYVLFLNADGTAKSSTKIASGIGGGPTLADRDSFDEVTSLGDLDGDGITDIAVESRLDDTGGDARGAVYVLFLNADGTVRSEDTVKIAHDLGGGPTLIDGDRFGVSVTSLGDWDGDSISDLAVGAYRDYIGGMDRGAVHILLLNADGTVKGTEFTFTVTRSGDTSGTSTVNYATANVSATAGSDYIAGGGLVTFDPGVTSQTIFVPVIDDTESEFDETFTVTLTNEMGATLGDSQGIATIEDDDNTTQTFVSSDVPKNIRDSSTLTSTISVANPLRILDINVELDISHTNDADLDVFLISPDGISVELFSDLGGSGNNFSATILDDDAATSIAAASVPFTGTFQPIGSLGDFNGWDAQGVWTLEISDDTRNKQKGTLNSWSLEITEAPPVGVTVTNTTGLVTTETPGGATASFFVVLDSPPTGSVFVHMIPSDLTEGVLGLANSPDQTLEFDETNWDVPVEVVVIGVDDSIFDEDVFYMILIDIFFSEDPDYLLIDPDDVGITNMDDEAPLHVAGGGAAGGVVAATSLTQATLQAVFDQAVGLWQATDPSRAALLNGVEVQIADYSGSLLGIASPTGGIWIDRDAAGFGWSINAGAVNPGRMDLLSVVSHELGHLIGMDHAAMGATLRVGSRYLVSSGFATQTRRSESPLSGYSFYEETRSASLTGNSDSEQIDVEILEFAPLVPRFSLGREEEDDSMNSAKKATDLNLTDDKSADDLFAEFNENLSDDLLAV